MEDSEAVVVDVVVDMVAGESVQTITDRDPKLAKEICTVHIIKADKFVVNKTLALDQEFKKDL